MNAGIGVATGVGRVVSLARVVGLVGEPLVDVGTIRGDGLAFMFANVSRPVKITANTSNTDPPIIVYRQARGSFCLSVFIAPFCSDKDEGSSCAGLCSILCIAILPFVPGAGAILLNRPSIEV